LKAFERYEFRPIPLLAPHNLEREIAAWRWAYDVRLREEDGKAIAQWYESRSEDEYAPLRARYDLYFKMSYYYLAEALDFDMSRVAESVNMSFIAWEESPEVREPAMEEIALLQKAYENAIFE